MVSGKGGMGAAQPSETETVDATEKAYEILLIFEQNGM